MVSVVKAVIWITLINPLNIDRTNELVIIPFNQLGEINSSAFVVRCEDKILPSQLEDTDFDGKADALAFLVDLNAKEQLKVSIQPASKRTVKYQKRAHAEVSVLANLPEAAGEGKKVDGGRYVSKKRLNRGKNKSTAYRFEGPLIESDKVGYRIYADQRGAVDIYGKTGDMFVGEHHTHKVSHHTMQPWGRDLLHNGDALGVGGLGIGVDSKRFSPSGAPDVEMIVGSDGPIRASYRMIGRGIEYKGQLYDVVWDMSMSAGKRYIEHKVTVTKGGPLDLLAALTNHLDEGGVTENCSFSQFGQLDWLGTYGKQVYRDEDPELAAKSKEQMGMGLLWPMSQLKELVKNDLEFDVFFKPAKQVKYYSLAAYNEEYGSAIKSEDEFYSYMHETAKCLANPIIVKLEDSSLLKQYDKRFEFAGKQLSKTIEEVGEPNKYPNVISIGDKWECLQAQRWISGFLPGCLWYMYEWSGDMKWKELAETWTESLEDLKFYTGNHDIGFMMGCSYGNGLRLTENESYKPILLQSAKSLTKRYSPAVGCIRSWGSIQDQTSYKVIIDNMMNLELLFWASKNGGGRELYDIAVKHAFKTMKGHIRSDGSTYHVVEYDPVTGAMIGKRSAQGYALESCWARGQAWGVYGFTVTYRETKDKRFLETAMRLADYFINNLPEDFVPYWDFNAAGIPDEKRDASAAAIAASGLLELSTLVTEEAQGAKYFAAAENILGSLSSPKYLAEDKDTSAILYRMVGSRHDSRDKKIRSYIFGDYYYLEALTRYKKLVKENE